MDVGPTRFAMSRARGDKGGFEAYGQLVGLLCFILISTQPSSHILFLWGLCMHMTSTEGCVLQTYLPGRAGNESALAGKASCHEPQSVPSTCGHLPRGSTLGWGMDLACWILRKEPIPDPQRLH